jgi:CRISPR-associated protein Cas2
MAVIITRDVADRYRGFLASVMPEIGPGIYVSPNLSPGVRDRIWTVLDKWWLGAPGASITMTWRDDKAPGRLGIRSLGIPVRELVDIDGQLIVRRSIV